MPQWYGPNGEENCRTSSDTAIFGLMLGAIADLYLTAYVLILLDGSYGSRFWVRAVPRSTCLSRAFILSRRCPTISPCASAMPPPGVRRR